MLHSFPFLVCPIWMQSANEFFPPLPYHRMLREIMTSSGRSGSENMLPHYLSSQIKNLNNKKQVSFD